MASPRVVSEDRKSDDLEIVSVGALYTGSWDKKYWSSSRVGFLCSLSSIRRSVALVISQFLCYLSNSIEN